jgi:hypothetical protein
MYCRIIKNKSFIVVPKFGFKNKVVLKPDNLEIRKQINYLKVTLRNEDINLKTKSFYFGTIF